MNAYLASLTGLIVLVLYVLVVAGALWLILRLIRAVEQIGRALEDIASTMKKERT